MVVAQGRHVSYNSLVAYGDFLRWAMEEGSMAVQIYREALQLAEEGHYMLLKQVAEDRLKQDRIPFQGLTRFGLS